MIDHSLLHPTYTDDFLRSECHLVRKLNVASVCIKLYAVGLAKEILAGTTVKVCTVAGFPHCSHSLRDEVNEVKGLCKDGATEIDFVVNIGKVLSQDWNYI